MTARLTLMLLGMLLAPPALGQDADVQQPDALTVRATGKGYAPKGKPARIGEMLAKRAARTVALRNLLLKLGRMSPKGDDSGWLRGYVQGFRVVSETRRSDGGWDVTVELPISSLVMRLRLRNKQLEETVTRQKAGIKTLESELASLRQRLAALTERLKRLVTRVRAHLESLGEALKK